MAFLVQGLMGFLKLGWVSIATAAGPRNDGNELYPQRVHTYSYYGIRSQKTIPTMVLGA